MSGIALTIGNTVKSFPALYENKSRKVQKKVRNILNKTINEVLRELRTPNDVESDKNYIDRTGKLRGGWRKRRLKGYKYRISNRTKYASFIENGTRYITERRMLHRALYNARFRLRRRLRALDKKVKRGQVA